jgi:crotonobetainyl-CoA:carnitine CoA-transferase CaiB-like acyl-CoA transferase
MLEALGMRELIPAATGPNGPGQMPVKAALADAFLKRTRDEWEAFFASLDVCAAPVLDLREAFHGPQAQARQMLLRDDAGNLHIGTPPEVRGRAGGTAARGSAPR